MAIRKRLELGHHLVIPEVAVLRSLGLLDFLEDVNDDQLDVQVFPEKLFQLLGQTAPRCLSPPAKANSRYCLSQTSDRIYLVSGCGRPPEQDREQSLCEQGSPTWAALC